jgi:hypothetical protein
MSAKNRQDPEVIRALLLRARTIAIVGLSANELRASNFVGFYMKRHGYRVIPVNPREQEALGERCYPDLGAVPERIDIVDVFRQPDAVPQIARDAVRVGAKALWLQFGVVSEEGAAIAEAAGLDVVMDRCLKIEHARYFGRMHWLGFNTEQVRAYR